MSKYEDIKYYKHLFPDEKGIDKNKLKLTDESLYSITKPYDGKELMNLIIKNIREKLNTLVITDATANVGGDTINFSKYFKKVNAVELNKLNCGALQNNVSVYNRKNVKVFCNDYVKVSKELKQDVIYMDPPWGGVKFYNFHKKYSKNEKIQLYLGKYNIVDVFKKLRKKAKYFILKLPFNYDYLYFFRNVGDSELKSVFALGKRILFIFIKLR